MKLKITYCISDLMDQAVSESKGFYAGAEQTWHTMPRFKLSLILHEWWKILQTFSNSKIINSNALRTGRQYGRNWEITTAIEIQSQERVAANCNANMIQENVPQK